MAKLLGFC